MPGIVKADIPGARVLEVGSFDVNGSVRPAVEAFGPALYIGVDQQLGPRVDRVVPVDQLVDVFGSTSFDVVISTEMLEHAADWEMAVSQMAAVLDLGGLLIITTRSEGFPYHPFPGDWWRFSVDAMIEIVCRLGFCPVEVESDPQFPGVFAAARKLDGSSSPLGGIQGVTAVKQP